MATTRAGWPALGLGLAAALLASCGGPPLPEPSVVLYSRHYLEPIYLETVPEPEEVSRPVKIFAARGEYEPASVGVFSHQALAAARLEASALSGPEGAVIPAAAVEVLITRYIEPMPRWVRPRHHDRLPGYLDAAPAADVPARGSRQFWVTVHVPEQAAAGTYHGRLSLQAAGRSDLPELPLTVEVLPFTLPEARPSYFLYGNNYPLSEQNFIDAREHGMNTLVVNHGWPKRVIPRYFAGGRFEYPDRFSQVVKVVELARRHGLGVDHPIGVMFHSHLTGSIPAALAQAGLTGPDGEKIDRLEDATAYTLLYPKGRPLTDVERQPGPYYPVPDPTAPPATFWGQKLYQGWLAAFRTLEEVGREHHWPGLWYYLIDEPHHSRGGMRLAIQLARAADEAGADGMITCNEPTVSEPDPSKLWFQPVGPEPALVLEPFLRTRCYHNKYLGPQTLERTRAAGDHYGTYINIYGNQPASTRFLAGYLAHRLSLEMVMLWQWKNVSTDYDGGRSYLRDWEAAREGIDDLKYLQLLETLVERGRGPAAAIEHGRQVLEAVRQAIPTSVRAIGHVDSVSGRWEPGSKSWSATDFDRRRRQVAEAIVPLLEDE